MAELKGVIFDFDGTLADSNYVWEKVDKLFFENHGMSVPEDYLDHIGTLSFKEGAIFTKNEYGFEESIEEIMAQWNELAQKEYEEKVDLKPYVKEYIMYLKKKNIKMSVATATNPEYYKPVLEKNGLSSCFEFIVDGSFDIRNKEFPDMYKLCADKMGLAYKECVVFEDNHKGLKSAKSLGMFTIAVDERNNQRYMQKIKENSDMYIFGFNEMFNFEGL